MPLKYSHAAENHPLANECLKWFRIFFFCMNFNYLLYFFFFLIIFSLFLQSRQQSTYWLWSICYSIFVILLNCHLFCLPNRFGLCVFTYKTLSFLLHCLTLKRLSQMCQILKWSLALLLSNALMLLSCFWFFFFALNLFKGGLICFPFLLLFDDSFPFSCLLFSFHRYFYSILF